jgi:hypothetical protein
MSLFEEVAAASIVAYVQRISLYFVLPIALLLLFAAFAIKCGRCRPRAPLPGGQGREESSPEMTATLG